MLVASQLNSWMHFFANPWAIGLSVLLPLLGLLAIWSNYWRNRALRNWTAAPTLAFLPPRRWPGRILIDLAALSLILGIAGPMWDVKQETPTTAGRDVMILLDVSRSMLAEDKPPLSRLTRSKQLLGDWLDTLQRQGQGHRVGLMIFAGRSRLLCPITEDLDHVRFVLRSAGPFSFHPEERVNHLEAEPVGTSYLSVITGIIGWLKDVEVSAQSLEVILLSDGEDVADDAEQAARLAQSSGITLHTLAVGDSQQAWPIPWNQGYLMHTSAEGVTPVRVETKRNDASLRLIANRTQGVFLTEDEPQSLVHWWHGQVSKKPPRILELASRQVPVVQPGWFMLASLFFLFLELSLGGSWKREW